MKEIQNEYGFIVENNDLIDEPPEETIIYDMLEGEEDAIK